MIRKERRQDEETRRDRELEECEIRCHFRSTYTCTIGVGGGGGEGGGTILQVERGVTASPTIQFPYQSLVSI